MNEKLLDSLAKLTEALNKVSDEIRDLTLEICRSNMSEQNSSPTVKEDVPSRAHEEKKYTFEEVRGLMATLASSGKKDQAKALLTSLNVTRLSEVKESDYGMLATKAKELING